MHELAEELLSYDGKIYRSVWLLFAKPGFLTREAFADRRASYVSPLRLYLFFSVVFFAAFAFAPNVINATFTPDDAATIDPALLAEKTNEIRAAANQAVNAYLPRVMFVLMPIFAALVMLVVRRGGLNYPQHLYYAMHVHAVAFGAGMLIVLANVAVVPYLSEGVKVAVVLFVIGHTAAAFHVAYGTSVWGTLWRATVVIAAYWIVTIVALLAIWLPVALPIMTGRPENG